MKSLHACVLAALLCGALSATAFADGKITGTVDAKPSKYLKDTIVYVKQVPNTKLTAKTGEMDQRGMAFVPHILLIAVGDTVTFKNSDPVDHNVMSPDGGYDLGTWGRGGARSHVFTKPGVFTQLCRLHPEMLGYVFVGQNRLAAIVDASGGFTIDGVPPGAYEVAVWNPKLKAAAQKVTVADKAAATVKFSLAR